MEKLFQIRVADTCLSEKLNEKRFEYHFSSALVDHRTGEKKKEGKIRSAKQTCLTLAGIQIERLAAAWLASICSRQRARLNAIFHREEPPSFDRAGEEERPG